MDEIKLNALHEHNIQAAMIYEQKQQVYKEKYEVIEGDDEITIVSNDYTRSSVSTEDLRKMYGG